MDSTTATRRIFGIEKKNRIKVTVSIEKEILEALNLNNFVLSDTINISLQRLINRHGIPVLLLTVQDQSIQAERLGTSDILNIALLDLLQQKRVI